MGISRREAMIGGVAMAGTAGATAANGAAPGIEPAIATSVEQAVRQAIQAHACPGAQIAIARQGAPLLSKGFGAANLETGTPVDERSVFRIGSLTKQFTAAAVIRLAADGRISLDDPVAKHLPFMGKLKTVSLLELLHQTAGLHSDEESPFCLPGPEGPKTQVKLAEEIASQAKPFDFEPGTAWLYSNANYIVLGAVVEAVAGKPFAEAMPALVFDPLGLTSTAADRSGAVVAGRASGYTPVVKRAEPFDHAAYVEVAYAGGAGALRSTALDLCRWHAALLSNRLFGRRWVELMMTPGRLRDGRLSGANRFSPQDASYGEVQYACGLLVSPPSDPQRTIIHYGAIDGFAAVLETYVDLGLTVAILCNGDMGPDLPFRSVRRLIKSELVPRLV
jgi:D-alanyl-D-alanine carboxypeptidase